MLLREYLEQIAKEGCIKPENVDEYYKTWCQIYQTTKAWLNITIPEPDACPGPDGEVLYTWDKGIFHLECELFPDKHIEFYMSAEGVEPWYDERCTGILPSKLIEIMAFMFG